MATAIDVRQLEDTIVWTLRCHGLWSVAATNLLLGTAAIESGMGMHTRQIGGGPALGWFQIEPTTFDWLKAKYRDRYIALLHAPFQELGDESDPRLAILVARLRYLVVRDPLPHADNLPALAEYWKKHYNTRAGAGTVEKFLNAWALHVVRQPWQTVGG